MLVVSLGVVELLQLGSTVEVLVLVVLATEETAGKLAL